MNSMEKAVLDMIEKRYKRKYVGGIKITKLGLGWAGYKLQLDLGNKDHPMIEIAADLEAEDFLKFIERELISRQLIKVQWFTRIKTEIGDEQRRTCQQDRQCNK